MLIGTVAGRRQPSEVAQAIHHADDHRSHVVSILGARGLEIPALDVCGYAESTGQMQLDPSRGRIS